MTKRNMIDASRNECKKCLLVCQGWENYLSSVTEWVTSERANTKIISWQPPFCFMPGMTLLIFSTAQKVDAITQFRYIFEMRSVKRIDFL